MGVQSTVSNFIGQAMDVTTAAEVDNGARQRELCAALRQLQNQSSCSTRHLQRVIDMLSPYMQKSAIPHQVEMADRFLHAEAGVETQKLFSCANCTLRRVWIAADVPERCPQCDESMRDSDGVMHGVYYFPLKRRLQALLQTPHYRNLLQFESVRNSNRRFFTDVYDAPAWENAMRGVPKSQRYGLLFCMDGYDGIGDSMIPAEWCALNLPPWERYKAKNMLLYMLIPKRFSAKHQSKFFDYVIEQELRPLYYTPIGGKVVRVIGISMDLRGREKFLRQRSCTSYFGCSVCQHKFAPGLNKKLTFTGARLWLPFGHALRNSRAGEYDFPDEERR